MMHDHETPGRLFTVEEANGMLPGLRVMLARVAEAHEALIQAAQELERIERRRDRATALQLARPLREARERLGAAVEARRAAIAAIVDEGVQIKNVAPALLDFPAWRDGRVVLLCWRDGEPSVGHWHDVDAGFAGRRPL